MLSETWSLFIGLEICKRCRFCAAGWFKKNPKNKYLGDCQARLTKKVLSVWRLHTLRALSRPSFLRGAQVASGQCGVYTFPRDQDRLTQEASFINLEMREGVAHRKLHCFFCLLAQTSRCCATVFSTSQQFLTSLIQAFQEAPHLLLECLTQL